MQNRREFPKLIFGALVMACVGLAAEEAPLPKAVWLTYARNTPTHVTVNWATEQPCAAAVRYGSDEVCRERAEKGERTTLHQVEVPLPEAGSFFYRLECGGAVTEAVKFAGRPGDELRVAMVADWGFAGADVSALLKEDLHLLVTGGDHVMGLHGGGIVGDAAKTNLMPHLRLLGMNPSLFRHVPVMPVLGNHDREIRPRGKLEELKAPVYDTEATAFRRLFPLPDKGWAWRFELPAFGVRFVGVDLNHVQDLGTLLQTCHDYREASEQLSWYRGVMEGPGPRFTLTLNNEKSSVVQGLARGEWARLMRRGTLTATGFGYFAERAEKDGYPWFNTSMSGKGAVYKDSASCFIASENSYLLFRFRKGSGTMRVEIKRLADGQVLDASEWPRKQAAPACAAGGADWPCWRGPERNGVSREAGWSTHWGTNGLPVLWRTSVGKGFSSFAVADGRACTLGNTDGADTVFCFDALTGKVLWRHRYSCELQPLSYEGGPGATPAMDGGRVFTFSKDGHLFCIDAQNGNVVWQKKFELWPLLTGDWKNNWRYAGSPLLSGDRLYMSLGQSGMAFNKKDGAVLWQSQAGHPGYSSPVPLHAGAADALAFFSGHAVIGAAADTGKRLWEIPWKTEWDFNAADPIVSDGKLFVSSGNNAGCALYDTAVSPPRELWRNKNLKTPMNGAVLWQGHLYGFNDADLTCVEWATGAKRWSEPSLRRGSLIIADGKLLLLCEKGTLVVAEATAEAYRPLAQAQVLSGRCWTTPVLSHGLIYARNAAGEVVCLDARPPANARR